MIITAEQYVQKPFEQIFKDRGVTPEEREALHCKEESTWEAIQGIFKRFRELVQLRKVRESRLIRLYQGGTIHSLRQMKEKRPLIRAAFSKIQPT